MTTSNNAITKGMILGISSNKDVFERGEKYYRDGKLLSYTATDEISGETKVRATIEGHYKNYEVTLRLTDKNTLISYACSCESHSIWRGACKHVVAALFAQMDGHARLFSAGKMRQYAHMLTNKLEEIIYDNIDDSLVLPVLSQGFVAVRLVPTICCTANNISVSLSIGRSRLYVIKSLAQLVESYKTGEKIAYGQGLTVTLKPSSFDEQSLKLLEYIVREVEMYTEVGRHVGKHMRHTQPRYFTRRDMQLTQRNIDEFFDIFTGQTLDCESIPAGMFGDKIKLSDETPPLAINIRHTENETIISSPKFTYRSIVAKNNFYVFLENVLYRIPKSEGRVLALLLKCLDEAPNREIIISGNDRQKFLSVVLPQIKRLGFVDTIEGNVMVVMPLAVNLFFDSDKRDITCRVEFQYGDYNIDAFATDNNSNISRDIVAEYVIRRRLVSNGFLEDKKNGVYRLSDDDLLHDFLHGGIEKLRDIAVVYISDDLQKKTIQASAPQIGLRLSGNLLHVSLEDSGYSVTELLDALEAYRTRKKYHRLKDGRFLSLEDETINATAGFLDAMDVTRKEITDDSISLPAFRALYVNELVDTLSSTHALKRDEGFDRLISHFANDTQPQFTIPRGLSSTLREYQKAGYYWLKTLALYGFGGILADDMGLGKTLQIISVLDSDRSQKKPSIVVCPTSLLYNWQNEIARFAPKLRTVVVSGLPEKRHDLLKSKRVDVFITTYDMLKRDIDFYSSFDFAYIIADEAQNIKNPTTRAAKSLKSLNGRVRFALTGTPIENTLTELWSIFDFIMPGYLHSAHKFSKIYETPIIKYGDANIAVKLRKLIAPFVMRRIKQIVLKELPEKTETVLPAELTPEQRRIYHATLLETVGAFDEIIAKNTFADNRMRILAQLTRLRQICCHPSLFLEGFDGGSGKLDLTMETIQIALESGHRVLLFSQFTGMLGLIKDALSRFDKTPEYFYLDGAVKARDRLEMTERFNAGERELFLISLKAGGAGLNLTGADVVIHYDPWWNPSVMDQASDRAHRYGQKKAVQVFNIVAKDTIEEKIMSLQEKKRGLIDSVITEGGSFINLLSEEEVRNLFA